MTNKIDPFLRWVRRWIMVGLLMALLSGVGSTAAWASLHTYPENDGQILYRSRLSLQDDEHQAWQIILFKRVKAGQVQDFKLRIVGFPGQIALSHPTPMRIGADETTLSAIADQTLDDPQLRSQIDSVGQYDVRDMMLHLDQAQRLEAQILLKNGATRRLVIPKFMVREWLTLKEQMP